MIYMLMVFLAGCSFGLVSTVVKLAYASGLQPDAVIFAQFFLGWAILVALSLFVPRHKIDLKTGFKLIMVGITNSLAGILFFLSLKTLPASIAIVIMFQFTWIGVIIEAIADRKWPGKEKLFSLPFLIMGILLAGGVFGSEIKLDIMGVIYACLTALTFAFFIFFSGCVAPDHPPVNRSVWIISGALLFTLVLYPPKFLLTGGIEGGLIGYGLILGLLGPVIPTLFLAKGVPHIGPGMATILASSELPVAVIASAIMLGEYVSLIQWCGVLLILLGICLPQFNLMKNQTGKAI